MAHTPRFPKLFVTDLDGTALGGNHVPYRRFPDPFSRFLDHLADRGCMWAINTTWDIEGQWDLVLGSSVKSRPVFLMGQVGMQLARVTEAGPQMEQAYCGTLETEIACARRKWLGPLAMDLAGRYRPRVMHFYGHWFDMAPDGDEKSFFSYVKEQYADDPRLVFRLADNGHRVVFYPSLLSKGRALHEVIRLLRLSPDEVVAAGDETTDLTMMAHSCAKYSICPENAEGTVKEWISQHGGVVGDGHSSEGIIDAFRILCEHNGWRW